MTALRILNVVIWGAMMAFMATGAWSAVFGREQRRGDAMRLACFVTAFVMVGFNVRWLVVPEAIWLWQVLYILSAGAGCYIVWLGYAYGRGPRV